MGAGWLQLGLACQVEVGEIGGTGEIDWAGTWTMVGRPLKLTFLLERRRGCRGALLEVGVPGGRNLGPPGTAVWLWRFLMWFSVPDGGGLVLPGTGVWELDGSN